VLTYSFTLIMIVSYPTLSMNFYKITGDTIYEIATVKTAYCAQIKDLLEAPVFNLHLKIVLR